ncbi:MAG TPA: SGNH/GDSL hydrolase family protein [Thermoanaerobaculia bacterium]|jgi:lysophospholipase L1-like esterase|nr:SGNH/GDSL hydrolase family protein [Thermoanaerobaculia bacterium]
MRHPALWLALSILGAACVAWACSGDPDGSFPSPSEPSTVPGLVPGTVPLRYLALGDSYTIGEGVPLADTWPVQLAELVRPKGPVVGEPRIIARTGWTVAELSAGIDSEAPKGFFDLVTLLIGVNDQYRGGDAESYRPQLAKMLARAVAFAGGAPRKVVVLSIPDWGVMPFAQRSGRDPQQVSAAIDRFNAVAREETLRAGARFVDVTPASRRAGADPALRAADGLHYSRAMYGEWAALALPDAYDVLAQAPARTGRARRPKRTSPP